MGSLRHGNWILDESFKTWVEKKGQYFSQQKTKEMIKDVQLKNGQVSTFSKIPTK